MSNIFMAIIFWTIKIIELLKKKNLLKPTVTTKQKHTEFWDPKNPPKKNI
jgi:hypothetical protein